MALAAADGAAVDADEPTTFEALGVCAELAQACAALGWKAPTSIQRQSIPLALSGASAHELCCASARLADDATTASAGKDVIGLAQTGAGKTGAFALPILQARAAHGRRSHAAR